jgi:hypothetical protein
MLLGERERERERKVGKRRPHLRYSLGRKRERERGFIDDQEVRGMR